MIQGSIVALVTPMLEDSLTNAPVDYDALVDLIDFHLEQKTDAIVVAGTTGESATLTATEHCELIRFTVKQVAGRVPVIAGTGANSTHEALELTKSAKQSGADACLLVTPYYNKPTQEGLYLHHKLIAESVAIPQILYNVPGRTAVDFLPETVLRLADVDNIIGIKEATGDIERAKYLIEQLAGRMDVYSGDDATAMECILAGAKGDISVTANIAPLIMHEMCQAALAGDRSRAEALNQQVAQLHEVLFCEANPIPIKWALHAMNKMSKGLRLPMTVLGHANQQKLAQAMTDAGIEIKL